MKKQHKRILQAAVCLCFCFLMLTGAVMPSVAANTEAEDLFDYRSPALGNFQSLSASEIFYRIYGYEAPDAEKKYLDELSGITLRYTDIIPDSIVSTDYNGEMGTLDVTVPTYTYTANNGVLVRWVPQSATLEGVTKTFSEADGIYGCRFEDLLYSKDFDIYVTFSWVAELPAEAVDLLLTKPYLEGSAALEKILAYEETYLNPYLAALEKYRVYTAYLQAIEDHKQYLADMKVYEAAMVKYEAYLKEYKTYTEKQASYEAYLKNKADWEHYYDYQKFLTNDLDNYNNYLLYQDKVNKVLAKLAVLESLFVSDSHNWTFYPSLMGNTVTSVTSRKDELITAGCNATDILAADAATADLRRLMTDYSNLRKKAYATQHDKITALYDYYTKHYTEIRDSFAQLYGALIALYDNEFVVIYADKEGKLERFQQFMGQLYVTTTCLDDSEKGMRMENWKISGKSLSTVVEPVNLIPDTGKSNPNDAVMPETEVERVEAVEPIEKPAVTLAPVSKPTAPTPMSEPVKPQFVAEPDTQNPPPAAAHPGEEPARPPMSETLWDLAQAIRAGAVPRREAEGKAQSITLEKTIACPISIHNLKTVTFYDEDGSTVLYQQKVDYGTSVTYEGPSVQKNDPYYVYSFKGWVFSDGTPAVFHDVRENLSIFANYQKDIRTYKITWIIDGEAKESYHPYGEIPKPPFSLEKPGTVDKVYQFQGWDKEVVPVTESTTYTGSFVLVPRTYQVTWVVGGGDIVEEVVHGSVPTFPKATPSYSDGVYYYKFLGWDKDITKPVTGDRIFYAHYASAEPLAKAGNGAALSVTNDGKSVTVSAGNSDVFIQNVAAYAQSAGLPLTLHWDYFEITYSYQQLASLISSNCAKVDLSQRTVSGGIAYTISYQDASGKDTGLKLPASLTLYTQQEDGSGCTYAIPSGSDWVELKDKTHGVTGSATLLVKKAYRITVESNEHCNTSAMPLYAIPGDWVSIDLGCEFGYEIVGVKVNGADAEVKNMKFKMPQGDISVCLKVERIVYHVTFTVDGEVYSQADYFLGDPIVLPQVPTKANDETYSYKFWYWSPAVTIATGSDRTPTYEAIFMKEQLNGVDPYHSGNNNNRLLNTFLPIFLGVVAVAVGALIFFRVRKKKKLAQTAETIESTEKSDA